MLKIVEKKLKIIEKNVRKSSKKMYENYQKRCFVEKMLKIHG